MLVLIFLKLGILDLGKDLAAVAATKTKHKANLG